MVRVKDKKKKGDDAFDNKKQKVGRKKLAPATATRAEVHARTLRLATSSAVANAPAAPAQYSGRSGSSAGGGTMMMAAASPFDGKRSRRDQQDAAKQDAVMAQHTFAELLGTANHYKAANRGSAFAAMAKALGHQEQRDLAAGREADRFAGFISIPTTTHASSKKTSDGKSSSSSSGTAALPPPMVTPLEKLKAYSAALEAITDTDDDARKAALGCLSVIMRNEWVSSAAATNTHHHQQQSSLDSGRSGRPASSSKATVSSVVGLSPEQRLSLEELAAYWAPQATTANDTSGSSGSGAASPSVFGIGAPCAERMVGLAESHDGSNNSSSGRGPYASSSSSAHAAIAAAAVAAAVGVVGSASAAAAPDIAEQDRMKAALQAVHVAFTHAMKTVRLAGVELLDLVLSHARPGAVMMAARAVCQQQRAYLPADYETSGNADVLVVTGEDANSNNSKKKNAVSNGNADGSSSGGGGDPVQRLRAEARAEEVWMVSLIRRLSGLVLRTKDARVLPRLLAAMLVTPEGDVTATIINNNRDVSSSTCQCAWHNADLVSDLLDDLLPQWSNAWKEFMELQLALFRQEEKLAMAIALGQAFATVLHFLKRAQMAKNAEERQRLVHQSRSNNSRGGSGGDGDDEDVNNGDNATPPPSSPTSASAVAAYSNSNKLLTKGKQQRIKDLFIYQVPVTMEEILKAQATTSTAGNAHRHTKTTTASRVELALVLAQVCAPLAGTDEGWAVLERFFKAVFNKTAAAAAAASSGASSPARPASPTTPATTAGSGDGAGGEAGKDAAIATAAAVAMAPPGPATAPLSPTGVLNALQVYLSVLKLFPKCVRTTTMPMENHCSNLRSTGGGASGAGGLWSCAAGNSNDNNSGNSVFEKLVVFAPSVLQAVVQAVSTFQQQLLQYQQLAASNAANNANTNTSNSNSTTTTPQQQQQLLLLPVAASRDSLTVLARLLLAASEVVALLARYPITTTDERLRRALLDVFLRVPRLLFSLRPLPAVTVTTSTTTRKRSRDGDDDEKNTNNNGNEEEGNKKSTTGEAAAATTTISTRLYDPTVLGSHPLVADMVVHRFLHPLWFMASSGHPLVAMRMQSNNHKRGSQSSPTSPAAAAAAQTVGDALRTSLQPLFGLSMPSPSSPSSSPTTATTTAVEGTTVMDGVLARCCPRTVAVAQEALFYLGVRDGARLTVLESTTNNDSSNASAGGAAAAKADAGFGLDDILLMLP